MTFKGRNIFPIICLGFTAFLFYIAIDRNELLNFGNVNNVLFNIVCFISALVTFSAFILFSREVYIDSEKLIIKSPFPSIVPSKQIDIKTIKSFKIQSLIQIPGYLLRLYMINDKLDNREVKKNLTFNIKEGDLDKLIARLKELNIKERNM